MITASFPTCKQIPGFVFKAYASSPNPLLMPAIFINDVAWMPDVIVRVIDEDPALFGSGDAYMTTWIISSPSAVIKSGDTVRVDFQDTEGDTATKSRICSSPYGPPGVTSKPLN